MIELDKSSTLVEEELKRSGAFASTTSGVSMEPLFRTHRDVVIIARPEGELKKYDVALYRTRAGKYVLHRVVKVKADEYLIRGDNTYAIEHVAKERVIGVLVEFNRKGKKYSCADRFYIIYSRVWNFIYPIRFIVHHIGRFFSRGFGFIKRLFRRKKTNGENN